MSIPSLTYRPFKADLALSCIHYKVKEKKSQFKVILDNISTSYQHGKLHAIMGPSGCGKSSLLNVLAGFNGIAQGKISLNSLRVDCKAWKDIITPIRSYILQDDFLIAELTVKEQLRYAVEFKVPTEVSRKERIQIVEILLKETGLKACENVRISLVSSGEKKRLSVASELVNYPPVMFLDEPTSGLDSTSCYRLVDSLKSVARSGCNIIATIHQPNSRVFAMFDTLTVLHDGGKIAYRGPAAALADTMEQCINVNVPVVENPAEVLFEGNNIKKLSKCDTSSKAKVIRIFAKREKHRDDSVKVISRMAVNGLRYLPKERHALFHTRNRNTLMTADDIKEACLLELPSSPHRFRSIIKRTVLQSRRDFVFMSGRLIAYFLTSLLTGVLFQFVAKDGKLLHSNAAFVYFMVKISSLGVGIVTIMHAHHYFDVFLREHINSWYGISHFFITRAIVEFVCNAVIAFIFPIFMWLMTTQKRMWWPTIIILPLIVTLHAMATHYFCLLPAMFAERAALPQLPFAVAMLQVLFGGYFILFDALPLWIFWGRYLIVGSFSFTAVMKLAYRTTDNEPVLITCETFNPICMAYKTGDDVLTAYDIDPTVSYWADILAIAAHCVGWFLIGWMLVGVYLRKERNAIARL